MKWSSQANVPAARDIVYLSEADVSDMCIMGPACSHDTQVLTTQIRATSVSTQNVSRYIG